MLLLNIFLLMKTRLQKLLKRKKLLTVLIVIAILAIGGFFWFRTQKPQHNTVRAKREDIVEMVTETGSIQVAGQTMVYSPSNGIVRNLQIVNGDAVSKDQTLFSVESSATQQEKQAALSSYLTAKTGLDDENARLFSLRASMFDAWDEYYQLATGDKYEESDGRPKNNERTLPEFHIASDTWRAAEVQYKEQQTAVSQAQADVSAKYLLYQATNNADVKAPIAGTVFNLAVSSGSAVLAKTATVSQPVLTIVTNPTVEAVVPLNESDIANVAPGQRATLMVNALNDAVYEGVVSRADSIGTSVGGVIRYFVYITIANPDEKLRSGMTVDTDIVTNTVPGVLSVPNAAVKPYQGGRAVRVPDKKTGKMTYVPVTIGVKGKERTEILKGIDENTDVILTLSNEQLKRSSGLFGN